ncbi:Gp49 family protein [Aggregatibacter actinomycetemcomitans]|uniref:Gp49 family protein n=1 Tax=Aggregatibacter actinomycetemcomitans TaxID=714 RepID=UPI0013A56611
MDGFQGTITICIIAVKNDFKIVGTSALVSKQNYDTEICKQIAYQNLINCDS